MTAGILLEGIVLQPKLLGKGITLRGSNNRFFNDSMQFSRRVILFKMEPTDGVDELTSEKLCNLFEITDLKQYQKQCMVSVLNKNNCFVCKSTGSGKSLVFQGLPFVKQWMFGDVTCKYFVLVIPSPISLTKDQEEKMKRIGVSVAVLSSEINSDKDTLIKISGLW